MRSNKSYRKGQSNSKVVARKKTAFYRPLFPVLPESLVASIETTYKDELRFTGNVVGYKQVHGTFQSEPSFQLTTNLPQEFQSLMGIYKIATFIGFQVNVRYYNYSDSPEETLSVASAIMTPRQFAGLPVGAAALNHIQSLRGSTRFILPNMRSGSDYAPQQTYMAYAKDYQTTILPDADIVSQWTSTESLIFSQYNLAASIYQDYPLLTVACDSLSDSTNASLRMIVTVRRMYAFRTKHREVNNFADN